MPVRMYAGRLSLMNKQTHLFTPNSVGEVIERVYHRSFRHTASHNVTVCHSPIRYDGEFIGGKFGRVFVREQIDFSGDDFESSSREHTPYVHYVYLDEQQVFLVEKHTATFQQPEQVFRYLESCIKEEFPNAEIAIEGLTQRKQFWQVLSQYSTVNRVTFELCAPNFFGLFDEHYDLAEKLNEAQEETKGDRFFTGAASSIGQLELPKFTDAMVRWVEDGGGEWEIEVADRTGKLTYSSKEFLVEYPMDFEREEIEISLLKYLRDTMDLEGHHLRHN